MADFIRKYGAQTVLYFSLFEIDGIDLRVDAVHATGDMTISKNEGAQANTTNGFFDRGSYYSVTVTATEMECARGAVVIVDQTVPKAWLDTVVTFETYGHASAQHGMDLDDETGATLTALGSAASLAAVDTNVDAILVDTGTTIPATLTTIDANVDLILEDTGTTLPATLTTIDTNVQSNGTAIAALNDFDPNAALTEGYAADGAAFTMAQALYMLWSSTSEFAINTTTITAKQLDGSTTSMTFTLDDATNPTSRTRAT